MKTLDAILLCCQGGRCFYCAQFFLGPTPNGTQKAQRWTRDHLKPRSQGSTLKRNRVLACGPCNQRKGDRDPTPEELARAAKIWEHVTQMCVCLTGSMP